MPAVIRQGEVLAISGLLQRAAELEVESPAMLVPTEAERIILHKGRKEAVRAELARKGIEIKPDPEVMAIPAGGAEGEGVAVDPPAPPPDRFVNAGLAG